MSDWGDLIEYPLKPHHDIGEQRREQSDTSGAMRSGGNGTGGTAQRTVVDPTPAVLLVTPPEATDSPSPPAA